jgi:hypothetical protein
VSSLLAQSHFPRKLQRESLYIYRKRKSRRDVSYVYIYGSAR